MPNTPITCLSVHHRAGENSHTSAYAYAIRHNVTGPLAGGKFTDYSDNDVWNYSGLTKILNLTTKTGRRSTGKKYLFIFDSNIGRLLYIFTNAMRLETHQYMCIRNTKLMYETFNLTMYCIHSFYTIL